MSHDHSSDCVPDAAPAPRIRSHLRTDFRTRDLVNQAIAAVPTLGVQQCAEYLSAMNVPPEVAIRALCGRRQRDLVLREDVLREEARAEMRDQTPERSDA